MRSNLVDDDLFQIVALHHSAAEVAEGKYPVEGGPERPWRDFTAIAGIMPDREAEPWRFRNVGGTGYIRWKMQGPQRHGKWSPPGPHQARNKTFAAKKADRLRKGAAEAAAFL